MELDSVFKFALVVAWDELLKVSELSSVRLEYEKESGVSLDHLSVWADEPKGYQSLVCNYWTGATTTHPRGARFGNGYHSNRLVQALGLIMENQERFTHPADAGHNGLVLVCAPMKDELADATAWMSESLAGPTSATNDADFESVTSSASR